MTREEVREARYKAANLYIRSGEHPLVVELYRLYKQLEQGYMDALERAIYAEAKLDKVRDLVRREIGDGGRKQDERGAAGGDLRPGQDGGAHP